MAAKIRLAALALGVALCLSPAIAKPPPGVDTYVPPQSTQQTVTGGQTGAGGTQASNGQSSAATPDAVTDGKPPAVADGQRRLSTQQRARMRACISNCLAAGMTGPFCSHSCIPD